MIEYLDTNPVNGSKMSPGHALSDDALLPSDMFRLREGIDLTPFMPPKPRDLRPVAVIEAEESLRANFSDYIAGLDFVDIARVIRRRNVVAPDLSRYCLVPVLSQVPMKNSLEPAGFCNYAPDDIVCDSDTLASERGQPFLNAQSAIGLVFDGTLRAVCSAGITQDTAHLRIVQIQAETKDSRNVSTRHLSGLYNGLDWRPTLVSGYVEIARNLGVRAVEIIGAKNATPNQELQERFKKGLDAVADSLAFKPRDDGDWVLGLTPIGPDL